MNRTLPLQARVEDVAEAEHVVPRTIAVTDEQIPDSPAWRYLDHHSVKMVPAHNSEAIKALIEPELYLR